jgi:hypothetical protein
MMFNDDYGSGLFSAADFLAPLNVGAGAHCRIPNTLPPQLKECRFGRVGRSMVLPVRWRAEKPPFSRPAQD